MKKNKLIAIAIILVLFTAPFHYAYLSIEGNGGIVQALCMGLIIIGSVAAILIFNKETSEAH
jgi:hypothetical protein